MNQLNSDLGQTNTPLMTPKPSKLSIVGIIFFLMGAPNLYAFMQRRAATTNYSGSGFPRYVLAVIVAVAIAGLVELSFI
jgi:hypothetical protein